MSGESTPVLQHPLEAMPDAQVQPDVLLSQEEVNRRWDATVALLGASVGSAEVEPSADIPDFEASLVTMNEQLARARAGVDDPTDTRVYDIEAAYDAAIAENRQFDINAAHEAALAEDRARTLAKAQEPQEPKKPEPVEDQDVVPAPDTKTPESVAPQAVEEARAKTEAKVALKKAGYTPDIPEKSKVFKKGGDIFIVDKEKTGITILSQQMGKLYVTAYSLAEKGAIVGTDDDGRKVKYVPRELAGDQGYTEASAGVRLPVAVAEALGIPQDKEFVAIENVR